jgi:ketosteroid isomerase-like protein
MRAWIARRMIERAIRSLNAGNPGPILRNYSGEAVLVFPGDHSWGARYQGRDEIERFFRRAIAVRLQFEITDVVVKGPPWNMTVCVRLTDRATAPDGTEIYANRVFEFLSLRWGRIVYQELYLDTQKVAEFDERLGLREGAADA